MVKIEINWCSVDDFTLGLNAVEGEDENGWFKMLTIGFLVFDIAIISYIQE